jgi:hypothetical protein
MPQSTDQVQAECVTFAEQFPTPQVRRGLELAQEGTISWEDLQRVYQGALADGLSAIEAEQADEQPPLIPARVCAECGEIEGSGWWSFKCHV